MSKQTKRGAPSVTVANAEAATSLEVWEQLNAIRNGGAFYIPSREHYAAAFGKRVLSRDAIGALLDRGLIQRRAESVVLVYELSATGLKAWLNKRLDLDGVCDRCGEFGKVRQRVQSREGSIRPALWLVCGDCKSALDKGGSLMV